MDSPSGSYTGHSSRGPSSLNSPGKPFTPRKPLSVKTPRERSFHTPRKGWSISHSPKHRSPNFGFSKGSDMEPEDLELNHGSLHISSCSFKELAQEALLPSFTAPVGKFKNKMIRIFKDQGSQASLVSQSLVDRLNLSVKNSKEKLSLKGVNSSKRYNMKTALVPIHINKTYYEIICLVLPKITYNISYPNLKPILREFLAKGHKLADQAFTNLATSLTEVDMVLGQDNGYILPENDIVLENDSIYSITPLGVMLKGTVSSYLNNLEKIPLNPYNPFKNFNKKESSVNALLINNKQEPEMDLKKSVSFDEIGNISLMDDEKFHENSLGEVTHVTAFKGSTRELTKRHVDQIIPLLPPQVIALNCDSSSSASDSNNQRHSTENDSNSITRVLPPRRAKTMGQLKLSKMCQDDTI